METNLVIGQEEKSKRDLLEALIELKQHSFDHRKRHFKRIEEGRKEIDLENKKTSKFPLVKKAMDSIVASLTQSLHEISLGSENEQEIPYLEANRQLLKACQTMFGLDDSSEKLEELYQNFVCGEMVAKVITTPETEDYEGISVLENVSISVEVVDPLNFAPIPSSSSDLSRGGVFERVYVSIADAKNLYGLSDKDIADIENDKIVRKDKDENELIDKVTLYIYQGQDPLNPKINKYKEILFSNKKIIKEVKKKYICYSYALNQKSPAKEKSFTAMGDHEQMVAIVSDMNDNKENVSKYIRRVARSKYGYIKGAQVDLGALASAEEGKHVGMSTRDAVFALPVPGLNPAILQYALDTERFAQFFSGILSSQQTFQGVGTATGQALLEQDSEEFDDYRLSKVKPFWIRLYKMLLSHILDNEKSEEIIIEVTGGDVVDFFTNMQNDIKEIQDILMQGQARNISDDDLRKTVAKLDASRPKLHDKGFEIMGATSGMKGLIVKLQKSALLKNPRIRLNIVPKNSSVVRLKKLLDLYNISIKDPRAKSSVILTKIIQELDLGIDPDDIVADDNEMMAEQQQIGMARKTGGEGLPGSQVGVSTNGAY